MNVRGLLPYVFRVMRPWGERAHDTPRVRWSQRHRAVEEKTTPQAPGGLAKNRMIAVPTP